MARKLALAAQRTLRSLEEERRGRRGTFALNSSLHTNKRAVVLSFFLSFCLFVLLLLRESLLCGGGGPPPQQRFVIFFFVITHSSCEPVMNEHGCVYGVPWGVQ